MTREQFYELKDQLKRTMEYQLLMSKTHNKPLAQYCRAYDLEQIHIKADEAEEELRHLTDRINLLTLKSNTTMSIEGHTRASGRYDYFDHVTYSFTTLTVKAEITPEQVERAMKQLVKKELGLQNYEHLECQVMQLFKDGAIEWADVQKSHSQECSI